MPPEKPLPPANFGERFSFGRWWQELVKGAESDAEFARAIGRSSTVVGDYRRMEQTPNSGILHDAAERMGIDYLWLAGRDITPSREFPEKPLFLELFPRWLSTHRTQSAAHAVRDIPLEAMERVTSKKPAPRKRANDR